MSSGGWGVKGAFEISHPELPAVSEAAVFAGVPARTGRGLWCGREIQGRSRRVRAGLAPSTLPPDAWQPLPAGLLGRPPRPFARARRGAATPAKTKPAVGGSRSDGQDGTEARTAPESYHARALIRVRHRRHPRCCSRARSAPRPLPRRRTRSEDRRTRPCGAYHRRPGARGRPYLPLAALPVDRRRPVPAGGDRIRARTGQRVACWPAGIVADWLRNRGIGGRST